MNIEVKGNRLGVWRGVLAPSALATAGRTSRCVAVVLATATFLATGLLASVAQAEPPTLISVGNFNSKTGWGEGIAVDSSSGDLYVAGLFNPETHAPTSPINKFDASGNLLAPPSPFGATFHSSVAVDPINGDVYALNAVFSTIEVFDPNSGAEASPSFPITSSHNLGPFTLVQIATDASGNVYVPVVPENEVLEYSPTGSLLNTFTGSGAGTLNKPTGVAVDSSGNLWVADTGNNRIEELSPGDAPVSEIAGTEGINSVAVDAQGDAYAILRNSEDPCGSLRPPCSHLVEYSPTGARLADIGAGSFGFEELLLPVTVAVDESTGRVYVSDGTKELVWVYGRPSKPVIGSEVSTEVSASEAKLGALVNPGGLETSYRFEYGPTTEYGKTTPFPEGNAGQGVTSRTVWTAAVGLQPGTTYHYRVVATNELGTEYGADQTFTSQTTAEASCPNEALRAGFSASLPDCRAYELVTPANKIGAQPAPNGIESLHLDVAERGTEWSNRFVYFSWYVEPGSPTAGEEYLATRNPSGWTSENLLPLQSYTATVCPTPYGAADDETKDDKMEAFSSDLSSGVMHDGVQSRGELEQIPNPLVGGGCAAEIHEIVPGEPLGVQNLLLRDNSDGSYQLINRPPEGVVPNSAHFQGASADLSHVVFSEDAQLTPNAPGGTEDLYDWSSGAARLVTVLPNGTPVPGSLAAGRLSESHPISEGGSDILFMSGGNLYDRIDGEHTIQIDASQVGGPGGGGRLVDASVDGSKILFEDDASADLTSDTVTGSGMNLYLYDLAAGSTIDLTPGNAPEFQETMAADKSISHVYFVARAVLTGSQVNERGEKARAGEENIYIWDGGAPTFIATLRSNSTPIETIDGIVSPNGSYFAFVSRRSLTGYDNLAPNHVPRSELFLYSDDTRALTCASCNPSGEPPSLEETSLITPLEEEGNGGRDSLSDNGRLFFQAGEDLLPADTNGESDIYEYEQGQLHLISSGTSRFESLYIDASESGNDVYFLTRQSLVPQDTQEGAHKIYDARIDGGFAPMASPPACTTADACRTPVSPQPSIYGAPSSQMFLGVGNLTSQSEAKPKKHAKSKKPKKRKGKEKACARNNHKRVHCVTRVRKALSQVKFHKGGK